MQDFTPDELASITTFDDAIALAKEKFGGESILSSDVLGDGFSLLKDKSKLIGVPCYFLAWSFSPGDFDREMVTVRVVAEMERGQLPKKLVINDGGTGIYDMLRGLTDRDPNARMVFAPKGLRVSRYNHPIHGKGETFYVDTSAPSA